MAYRALWKVGGVALAVLALGLAGCEDKKEAPATGGATAKPGATAKAKSTAQKKADKPKTAAYKAGDVVKYLPAECPDGRVYLNIGGISGIKGVAGEFGALENNIVASAGPDAEKGKAVLKALKDGGFDPTKTIREAAMCIDEKNDAPVVAAGLDLGKIKDPLELVAKAIEAGGKPKPKVEKEGDISYIKSGDTDGIIALVKPNVLVVAKDAKTAAAVAKGGGEGGFKGAAENLVWASVKSSPKASVDVHVADKGDNLDVKLAIQMEGQALETMKKEPEAFIKEMEGEATKMGDEVAKTPFKAIAERVKGAKFAVEGDKVVVTASVPKTDLVALIKAASTAKPEELMGMMK